VLTSSTRALEDPARVTVWGTVIDRAFISAYDTLRAGIEALLASPLDERYATAQVCRERLVASVARPVTVRAVHGTERSRVLRQPYPPPTCAVRPFPSKRTKIPRCVGTVR
jgi:hypothetical protein